MFQGPTWKVVCIMILAAMLLTVLTRCVPTANGERTQDRPIRVIPGRSICVYVYEGHEYISTGDNLIHSESCKCKAR